MAAAVAIGLAFGACQRDRDEERGASLPSAKLTRSRGPILPLQTRITCEPITYRGSQTLLYTDRPYHTQSRVDVLDGKVFCPQRRHGRAIWLLEVRKPALVHALASDSFGLEEVGWERVSVAVRVEAAGESFDGLYARKLEPGRYLLHQGHVATVVPVFWDATAAGIAAMGSGDDRATPRADRLP